jgi:hypothetical protein
MGEKKDDAVGVLVGKQERVQLFGVRGVAVHDVVVRGEGEEEGIAGDGQFGHL